MSSYKKQFEFEFEKKYIELDKQITEFNCHMKIKNYIKFKNNFIFICKIEKIIQKITINIEYFKPNHIYKQIQIQK